MTCSVLNASGVAVQVGSSVLNAAGSPIEVGIFILNGSGVPVAWCVVVEEQLNAGGEDPEDRRKRHMLIAAQKEDKLIISIVKAYMKNVF